MSCSMLHVSMLQHINITSDAVGGVGLTPAHWQYITRVNVINNCAENKNWSRDDLHSLFLFVSMFAEVSE